ncbi:MAG TPA: hypothetical protein VI412_11280 [Tabrizicola sp.]
MLRVLFLLAVTCLQAGPTQAACTNYGSLASFDPKRHGFDGPDFDDGTGIARVVVETEAGILPMTISSVRDARRLYASDGRGDPLPVTVNIEANACEKGSRRMFVRKYYRKLVLGSPVDFTAPLESPDSAGTIELLARSVLAATHCRGGKIGLDHNFIYIDARGATPKPGVRVPAVQRLDSSYNSAWSVHLTCSLWRER